ncbi:MAG: hypothetical protein AAF146_21640 [Bacteroidota bacterium]
MLAVILAFSLLECGLPAFLWMLGAFLLGLLLWYFVSQSRYGAQVEDQRRKINALQDQLEKTTNTYRATQANFTQLLSNHKQLKAQLQQGPSPDGGIPAEPVRETEVIRTVEVTKEVPVVQVKEVIKEVEIVREVPVVETVEVIKEIEVIKEVPVEVVKEVEVPKIVEIIKEVPVEIIREVEVIKQVEVIREKAVGPRPLTSSEEDSVPADDDPRVDSRKPTDSGVLTNLIGETKEDNLRLIEGIGPKIESILKKAGLRTWRILSQMTAEEIREILLTEGGERYKVHDPSSWPQQALLAADGKFDELKAYQKGLDGGKF